MIIEGILTTRNDDGQSNIAAMGATVEGKDVACDGVWHGFSLRPFEGSKTFGNLKHRPFGVFHLTDNVELLARAALSGCETVPLEMAQETGCFRLQDFVRAYEFKVDHANWASPRATLTCKVSHCHRKREWTGWNRAQFAVLELTISATRTSMIPQEKIREQIKLLQPLIEKTAGPREWSGWEFVVNYLEKTWAHQEGQVCKP